MEEDRTGKIVWYARRRDSPGEFDITLATGETFKVSGREAATLCNILSGAFLNDPLHLINEIVYTVPQEQATGDRVASIARANKPSH